MSDCGGDDGFEQLDVTECEKRVTKIHKRVLGKWQVELCGNEGMENDQATQYIRKLIQACITELERHDDSVWEHAKLIMYGFRGEEHVMVSGDGTHTFYILLDENLEATVTKKPLPSTCPPISAIKGYWSRAKNSFFGFTSKYLGTQVGNTSTIVAGNTDNHAKDISVPSGDSSNSDPSDNTNTTYPSRNTSNPSWNTNNPSYNTSNPWWNTRNPSESTTGPSENTINPLSNISNSSENPSNPSGNMFVRPGNISIHPGNVTNSSIPSEGVTSEGGYHLSNEAAAQNPQFAQTEEDRLV